MPLYRFMLAGALGGLGSGLLASILEISYFPTADLSPAVVLTLLGTIVPLFALTGLGLALLLLGLLTGGAGLAHLLRLSRERAAAPLAATLLALLSLPGLLLLLRTLASGRRASQMLAPLAVRAGLILGALLLIWGATYFGIQLGRRVHRSSGRALPLAVGLLLWAGAQLLFDADASLYERLYLYLHFGLLGAYLLAGLLGTLALWRALRPRGRELRLGRRGAAAALVGGLLLIGAGGLGSRRALASDQHLRYCALELAVVSSKLLLALPLEVRGESPLFLESAVPTTAARKGGPLIPDANVIMVTIDALRPDHLGAYGYQRPTSPNIDALAARSVRFESAYCQTPLTCYSVPSLHTGDYLRSTLPMLPRPPPTLARLLAGRGYTTAAFYNSSLFFCDDEKATSYGQNHFGFEYAETAHRQAEALTDQVIAYLHQFNRSGKRKVYLWVHYFDVHEPYQARPQFPFGNSSLDRYDSEIAYVDRSIGRLVAAIAELSGPTVFVLTSDHGEEFKEHGGYYHGSSLYEEQIRVPLIIGVPGLKPAVIKSPAQLVDVVPTLLGLLGLPRPEHVRGRSLLPLLAGREDADRAAYAEVHTKRAVRFRDWKLIDDYRRGTLELYDLRTDPRERSNLAGQRPAEVDRMKGVMQRWFDKLRTVASAIEKDRPEAIDLGRMGDRRARPLLAELLLDFKAEPRWRREAARLLGQLHDVSAAPALWRAVGDDDSLVAGEAAIALGEVKDRRAAAVLPQVMETSDVETRIRAGIALGRVDSPAATPALIQGLWSSNWETQNRAAHYLGFVGDRRGLAALLHATSLPHLRTRLGLALGRIGARLKDRRVMSVLLDWVHRDRHLETRLRALAGLAFLGDRRAVRPLARLLAEEPDLVWLPETLSRLGALGSYWVAGLDLAPGKVVRKDGWGECVNKASSASDDFKEASWCEMIASPASLQMNLQRRPFAGVLQLRVRPLESWLRGQTLRLNLNGRDLGEARLQGGWQIVRLPTRARHWRQGKNQLRLNLAAPASRPDRKALLSVDYVLLVPGEER